MYFTKVDVSQVLEIQTLFTPFTLVNERISHCCHIQYFIVTTIAQCFEHDIKHIVIGFGTYRIAQKAMPYMVHTPANRTSDL